MGNMKKHFKLIEKLLRNGLKMVSLSSILFPLPLLFLIFFHSGIVRSNLSALLLKVSKVDEAIEEAIEAVRLSPLWYKVCSFWEPLKNSLLIFNHRMNTVDIKHSSTLTNSLFFSSRFLLIIIDCVDSLSSRWMLSCEWETFECSSLIFQWIGNWSFQWTTSRCFTSIGNRPF